MSKGKILVVDADEDIRKSMDEYFTEQGYDVSTFANKDGIYDVVLQHKPNLLLLGLVNQDDADSNILLQKLRSNEETRLISVILLLVNQPETFMATGERFSRTFHYLVKPVDLEEMRLHVLIALKFSGKDY